jgi:hypothetical protein
MQTLATVTALGETATGRRCVVCDREIVAPHLGYTITDPPLHGCVLSGDPIMYAAP